MLVVANAQLAAAAHLLDAQASTASGRIETFLDNTVSSLKWIDDIDEPGVPVDYDAIRDETYRLFRRAPSIIGVGFFDHADCQRLYMSRLQPDMAVGCSDLKDDRATMTLTAARRAAGIAYSDVFFPDGSEPHLYVGIASRGASTGALLAEINLKVIHDTVAGIHVGKGGIGFLVDKDGRLIAHPDESLVLRQSRLPHNPPYGSSIGGLTFARDFTGRRVATTFHGIEDSSWFLIVEQPMSEALASVYAALLTTGALVIAATVGSLIAGYIVASRLSRPLSQLRAGAARIGQGDLATQLNIETGDEIEQVADEFNKMALALADSRAHLEAKVMDRTAALQATTRRVQVQAAELGELNAALAASLETAGRRKDDAERTNAAKSRFLAVASHDLRQPMHAISLLVGLLSQTTRETNATVLLKKVQRSVEAMEDLFGSLLDISKLDAGAMHPTIEIFSVEELFDRVRSSFGEVAERKGIALHVVSSGAVVRSDPALLERIVFNLVSNGIRYTQRGHVRVRAVLDVQVLRLIVEDTGIGIPPEHHERIYEEFFQISTPAGNRSGGLGLGLSIVKQCANLLGHALSMQSSASGTLFEIELPYLGTNDATEATTAHSREVSEALARAFVVVIDDDSGSRYATEETYRQWGCTVLSADSQHQILDALANHLRSPDLIVADLHLGSQSTGFNVVEAIRARVESSVPAIIVTGESGVAQFTSLHEPIVVLQKPVGAERLREVSERLLKKPPSSGLDQDIAPTSETKP